MTSVQDSMSVKKGLYVGESVVTTDKNGSVDVQEVFPAKAEDKRELDEDVSNAELLGFEGNIPKADDSQTNDSGGIYEKLMMLFASTGLISFCASAADVDGYMLRRDTRVKRRSLRIEEKVLKANRYERVVQSLKNRAARTGQSSPLAGKIIGQFENNSKRLMSCANAEKRALNKTGEILSKNSRSGKLLLLSGGMFLCTLLCSYLSNSERAT